MRSEKELQPAFESGVDVKRDPLLGQPDISIQLLHDLVEAQLRLVRQGTLEGPACHSLPQLGLHAVEIVGRCPWQGNYAPIHVVCVCVEPEECLGFRVWCQG